MLHNSRSVKTTEHDSVTKNKIKLQVGRVSLHTQVVYIPFKQHPSQVFLSCIYLKWSKDSVSQLCDLVPLAMATILHTEWRLHSGAAPCQGYKLQYCAHSFRIIRHCTWTIRLLFLSPKLMKVLWTGSGSQRRRKWWICFYPPYSETTSSSHP